MKHLALTAFFGIFSLLLLAGSFLLGNRNFNLQTSAQMPLPIISVYPTRTPTANYRSPTPSICRLTNYSFTEPCGPDQYRFIHYQCGTGYGASQGGLTSCKDMKTWISYASMDCSSKCSRSPTPPIRTPTYYRTPTPSPRVPTVTQSSAKYNYVSYNCRNDYSGNTYVANSNITCRTSYDWLKEINNTCYQRTAGTCARPAGAISGCVESYKFSPACAVKPSNPTPTPTARACITYVPYDYNSDGQINLIDYQIWLNKNQGQLICPTKTPTPTVIVCTQKYNCPTPQPGCSYSGGDGGCTSCGVQVCPVPSRYDTP